jgi:hypothetical protein
MIDENSRPDWLLAIFLLLFGLTISGWAILETKEPLSMWARVAFGAVRSSFARSFILAFWHHTQVGFP